MPGLPPKSVVPWLWILAWLLFWALALALAAWWVGGPVRNIWVWGLVWALGSLPVAFLLTRLAGVELERAANEERAHLLRQNAANLEARLSASTQSLVTASQTLAETTRLLLAQSGEKEDASVASSATSAFELATALETQSRSLDAASRDPGGTQLAGLPPLGLRPAPAQEVRFEAPATPVSPGSESPEATHTTAPQASPSQDSPLEAPPASQAGSAPRASTDWKWSDMLATVDALGPARPLSDVADIIAAEGLSADSIVDAGNAADGLAVFAAQGRQAMALLLAQRFEGPVKTLRTRLASWADERERAQSFVDATAARLAGLDAEARLVFADTAEGRRYLLMEAVLAEPA